MFHLPFVLTPGPESGFWFEHISEFEVTAGAVSMVPVALQLLAELPDDEDKGPYFDGLFAYCRRVVRTARWAVGRMRSGEPAQRAVDVALAMVDACIVELDKAAATEPVAGRWAEVMRVTLHRLAVRPGDDRGAA